MTRKFYFRILMSISFFGLIILAIIVSLFFAKSYVHSKVSEARVILKNTDSFKTWMNPPVPIFMKVYFFNITNIFEFQEGKEKPMLKQIGPYVYKEIRKKEIYEENDHKITYSDQIYYVFNKSVDEITNMELFEDDFVHIINFPIMFFLESLKGKLPSILNKFTIKNFQSSEMVIKRSVKELLWGFEDDLVQSFIKKMRIFDKKIISKIDFGLFANDKKNGSLSAPVTVHTGFGNVQEVGKILSWNNSESLYFWNGSFCNKISGSDGTLFPPFVETTQSFDIFSKDICRSLKIEFLEEEDIQAIHAYKFSVPPSQFQAPPVNQENSCFCLPEKSYCIGGGVLDTFPCQASGIHLLMSQPHFLGADTNVTHNLQGLTPNPSKHRTGIYIEPLSGVVLKAEKRLQLSVLLKKMPLWKSTEVVDYLAPVPFVWLDETFTIDRPIANQLRDKLISKVNLIRVLLIASVFLLCLLVVAFVYVLFKLKQISSKETLGMIPLKSVNSNVPAFS